MAYLGGFFGYGVGLSALYATTGYGLPCPFRAVTGWDCPFCGGTRLGSALLHGDLAAAWAFNPAVLVGLVIVSGLGVAWVVERFGGPRVSVPTGLVRRLRAVHPTTRLIAILAAGTLYTLMRNLA